LRLGGWMTVSNVVAPLILCADRVAIGGIVSVAAVTYYMSAYEIATKLWILQVAVTTVLFPGFWHSMAWDAAQLDSLFRRGLVTLVIVISLPALILVGFAHEILQLWLGPDIAAHSASLLRMLTLGIFFNCMANLPCAVLQSRGRSKAVALFQTAEVAAYLPLLAGAIYVDGLMGAALAWSIRAALDALCLFFMAFRWSDLRGTSPASVIWPIVAVGVALIACSIPANVDARLIAVVCCEGILLSMLWFTTVTASERGRLLAVLGTTMRGS
jgi:O-antigen/teichoic acid export membrane protein